MKYIYKKDAIKILYYLIAVDGKIDKIELQEFRKITKEKCDVSELDDVISECKNQINKAFDDDLYEVVKEGVEESLSEMYDCLYSFSVPVKWLVWNMIVLAYTDKNYTENERKLIKYVVRKCDLKKELFKEMEMAMSTSNAITKECEWIKNTNKPYSEIEKVLKQLETRQDTLRKSIEALINE